MTSKVRQRQTNITRFLEASLLRQAEGKVKNIKAAAYDGARMAFSFSFFVKTCCE
jgi:hypothetical protein